MELCENQRFIIGLIIPYILSGIGIVIAIVAVRKAQKANEQAQKANEQAQEANEQANKARAPLLKRSSFGHSSLQNYRFNLKNHGQTEAKHIKISYEIEHKGEIEIPEEGFNISDSKTTLGNQEEEGIRLNWAAEERITEDYYGEITVRITYQSDFSKPEPIKFLITIDRGEIKFGKVVYG